MPEAKVLSFDESGFTGYNLMDKDQPVMSIASADVGEDEAEAILFSAFPDFKGVEFSFNGLWATKKQRNRFINFAEAIKPFGEHLFSWVAIKRFVVITKICDYLVEPIYHDQGYDFYKNGYCGKYANTLDFMLRTFGQPELYNSLAKTYQMFSRSPSEDNLAKLRLKLDLMASSVPEELKPAFEYFSAGARHFHRFHDLSTFKGTDELQVSSMVASIAHWRKRCSEDFIVQHDQSANFFRRKELWDVITGPDVPEQLHPLGDGSHVQFPLRVISTVAIDSRQSRLIQLCDVLAGVTARHFYPQLNPAVRRLLDEIIDAGLGAVTFNGIRPENEFVQGLPAKRTGEDAVDKMVGILKGHRV